MSRRHRLLAVHLLAVLLPCGVVGLLGYKWFELERDAEARRGKEAAEAEAAGVRKGLAAHLSVVAKAVAQSWVARPAAQPPFAPTPRAPEIAASAYLFSPEGRLLYPNYEAAYRLAINDHRAASDRPEWQGAVQRAQSLEARGRRAEARAVFQELLSAAHQPGLQASVLLHLGRLALADQRYAAAGSQAWRIFECCAAARDEYGVSFALYAAAQISIAWKSQGTLRKKFPQLATKLGELIQAGAIGHAADVPEILRLVKGAGDDPASGLLLRQAEQAAARTARHIETGKRLERWIAGSASSGRAAPFSLFTFWSGARPQVAGLYRVHGSGFLVVVFATDRIAAWVAAWSGQSGHFELALAASDEKVRRATLQTALLPETPGFDLLMRARETDPATRERRQTLFAGAIVAAVLLILLVGYFALRDFSRELQLASLRSSFIAGVTHELKTPLTSIRLLAETLRMGRTQGPAVAEEIAGTIVEESERLSRLLDNVLSFSRIEKGVQSYRPVEIVLPEAVNRAVQRFQYILQQGEFRLLEETDDEPLRVYADADALAQALLNLLSNAVKYSGASREIRLGLRAHRDEAEISVTDRGIGIPASEQRRIFESFYRVPEAAPETTGAGLGLALVRHFAEAHGGRVTLVSEPGKGSTFSLWLPLVKEAGRSHGQDSHC